MVLESYIAYVVEHERHKHEMKLESHITYIKQAKGVPIKPKDYEAYLKYKESRKHTSSKHLK
jgi:hypothetical protein